MRLGHVEGLQCRTCCPFPGRERLDQPPVLAHPTPLICLKCGRVEFALADQQIEQLKNGVFPAQWKSASGH